MLQEGSWIAGLIGVVVSAVGALLYYGAKRFDPDVQAKAEAALWERVQIQLTESEKREREIETRAKERESKLEARIVALEEARIRDREQYERKIAELEEKLREKDLQIAELMQRQRPRGRTGGLLG